MAYEYLKVKRETITEEKAQALETGGWEEVGEMGGGLVRYRRTVGSGPSPDDVVLDPENVVKRFGVKFK